MRKRLALAMLAVVVAIPLAACEPHVTECQGISMDQEVCSTDSGDIIVRDTED